MVEIYRAGAVSPDFEDEPGTYFVEDVGVELDDIWVDGNPEKGFTDTMESILESLSDEHHKEAPGGQPFMDRIAYYVADMTHYLHGHTSMESGDFEEILASYGVESWE